LRWDRVWRRDITNCVTGAHGRSVLQTRIPPNIRPGFPVRTVMTVSHPKNAAPQWNDKSKSHCPLNAAIATSAHCARDL